MREEISIKRKDGTEEVMTLEQVARWVSLIESFNFIQDECERRNVNADDYLNSKAMDYYIKERYDSVRSDLKKEYYMGIL